VDARLKAAAGRTEKIVINICLYHAPGKEGGQMRGSEGGKYGIRYLALGGDVMGAPVKLFRSGPGAQRVHPI
jgi:hypothetical protein